MGKRKWSGVKTRSKRQRSGSLIEPGQYRIFVSCSRGREMKAAKEFKAVLFDKLEELYPKEEDKAAEAENTEQKLEVEDEIQKELASLKKEAKGTDNKKMLASEIPINADSLLFFHMRKPIVPSKFVVKFCDYLRESKIKNTKFVQRLTPIDRSCNANMEEFKKMAKMILSPYLKPGMTYSVNMTRRDFSVIERDDFMKEIANILPGCDLHYKNADIMIHVYCFKNNIGISVTDYKKFEELSKFNLQQIFEKAAGIQEQGMMKQIDNKADSKKPASGASDEKGKSLESQQ